VFDIEHRRWESVGARSAMRIGAAVSERHKAWISCAIRRASGFRRGGDGLARIVLYRKPEGEFMSASAVAEIATHVEFDVPEVTLWELMWAVSEVAEDEREVIATVAHMLTSGSVRVVGNPRDRQIRFA
jgi:hypothetical protein